MRILVVLRYNFAHSFSIDYCSEEITLVLRDDYLRRSNIFRWCREFQRRKIILMDVKGARTLVKEDNLTVVNKTVD